MSEVLTTLTPSRPRRLLGAGLLVLLGLALLLLVATRPPDGLMRQIFLALFGVACLLQARRGWRATANSLVLRRDGIFDLAGDEICALTNIQSVDRSMFAMKPSNGFLVRLHNPMPRRWAPGLFWRFGRRIGVGGSTPAAQGKQMADILAVLLSEKAD